MYDTIVQFNSKRKLHCIGTFIINIIILLVSQVYTYL